MGRRPNKKVKNITYIEHSGAEWVIAGHTVPPEIFHVIIERRPITEYTKYGKVTCGNLYLAEGYEPKEEINKE